MQRCDIFLIKRLTDVNQKKLLETRLWGHFKKKQDNSGTGARYFFKEEQRRQEL